MIKTELCCAAVKGVEWQNDASHATRVRACWQPGRRRYPITALHPLPLINHPVCLNLKCVAPSVQYAGTYCENIHVVAEGCCKSWSEIVLVQQGAVAFIRQAGVVPHRSIHPSRPPSRSLLSHHILPPAQIHILMCSCERPIRRSYAAALHTFSMRDEKVYLPAYNTAQRARLAWSRIELRFA